MRGLLITSPEAHDDCRFVVMAKDLGADGIEVERLIVCYETQEKADRHVFGAHRWNGEARNPFDPSRPPKTVTSYLVVPVPAREDPPSVG